MDQLDFLGLFRAARGVHKSPPGAPTQAPAAPVPSSETLVTVAHAPAELPSIQVPPHTSNRVVEPAGVVFRRSARARSYRLSLGRDSVAVATIPGRGSLSEAQRFVERNQAWLERARARQRARPRAAEVWTLGTHVLWRGQWADIRAAVAGPRPQVAVGADAFRVPRHEGDLRAVLEAQFARRARIELPARTWELAAETGVDVRRITVRNQRSRWGSCSAGGAISLNWRLVQGPEFVRDYIIYHELMHLREMNHSRRFWSHVEAVCPGWRDAELWIKRNGSVLSL